MVWLGIVLLACAATPPPLVVRERVGEQVPACIHWVTEARYRPYGYDHIVHIQNACSHAASCAVTTDVNPGPTHATVPANTAVEVVTWVGSASSEFTATVSCTLVADGT